MKFAKIFQGICKFSVSNKIAASVVLHHFHRCKVIIWQGLQHTGMLQSP